MKHAFVVLAACLALTTHAAAQDGRPPIVVVTPPAVAPTSAPTVAPTPSGTQYYAAPQVVGVGRRERLVIGTRHEMQEDRGLWGAGLGLFLAGWGLDIALTAVANAISTDRTDAAEQDAQAWSLLPIVGPLVQLGIEAPHPAIPILTELMQIGGLVCFIMGMTSTHDAEVPIYAFGDPHDARTARIGMSMTPTAGGASVALSLHL
jgi:hypothetical protein